MNTRQLYLDVGHLNRPGTILKVVSGIAVHWTANEAEGADAEANRNYFNRKWQTISGVAYELNKVNGKLVKYRKASAHLNVDDKELVEVLPWKKGKAEEGYHVGAESYKSDALKKLNTAHPNNCTIGLEICVNSDADFKQTYLNAVEVTAMMLNEHNLGLEGLFRHYDITGKDCPRFFMDDAYAKKYFGTTAIEAYTKFKKDVGEKLVTQSNPITKERIYESNGKIVYCNGKYDIKATDIRRIKFQTGKVTYKFVHEKNANVSGLVKKYGADYGFNGPFFNLLTGEIYGNAKDGTKVISEPYGKMLKRHEFVVKKGKPEIGQFDMATICDLMIQAGPLLIENGEIVYEKYLTYEEIQDDIGKSRCQRTFIWLDKAGDLNLGIADGRTNSDQGLSMKEMALYALEKGAVWALNLDGGGSTILADKNGGINQKLNTGANERTTHHAILVFNRPTVEADPKVDLTKAIPTKIDLTNTATNKTIETDGFVLDGVTYIKMRESGEFLGAKVTFINNKPGMVK